LLGNNCLTSGGLWWGRSHEQLAQALRPSLYRSVAPGLRLKRYANSLSDDAFRLLAHAVR